MQGIHSNFHLPTHDDMRLPNSVQELPVHGQNVVRDSLSNAASHLHQVTGQHAEALIRELKRLPSENNAQHIANRTAIFNDGVLKYAAVARQAGPQRGSEFLSGTYKQIHAAIDEARAKIQSRLKGLDEVDSLHISEESEHELAPTSHRERKELTDKLAVLNHLDRQMAPVTIHSFETIKPPPTKLEAAIAAAKSGPHWLLPTLAATSASLLAIALIALLTPRRKQNVVVVREAAPAPPLANASALLQLQQQQALAQVQAANAHQHRHAQPVFIVLPGNSQN